MATAQLFRRSPSAGRCSRSGSAQDLMPVVEGLERNPPLGKLALQVLTRTARRNPCSRAAASSGPGLGEVAHGGDHGVAVLGQVEPRCPAARVASSGGSCCSRSGLQLALSYRAVPAKIASVIVHKADYANGLRWPGRAKSKQSTALYSA